MPTVIQDLRYSLRILRRAPGFTAIAVLSIALGIGSSTAIFSLLNAFVFRLLPAPDPEQLVFVKRVTGRSGIETDFPYEAYAAMRDHSRSLADSFAYDDTNISVSFNGQAAISPAEFAGASSFPLLGGHTLFGRVFTAADDRLGSPPVVVISYAYWTRSFGRDPTILGKKVSLKRMPFTIVGVMPQKFLGRRTAGNVPDLWIPLAWQPQLRLKDHDTLEVMARLKTGVSAEQARQDLNQIYQQYLKSAPGPHPAAQSIFLDSAAHGVSRKWLASELRLLMIAVGLLLLIACANVANLLLTRAANRQREIAMRVSLGATRGRVVRQMLTESLVIAILGGICGLFLAWWASNLLLVTMGFDKSEWQPDGLVLTFTAAVSLVTALLFGLAPAIRSAAAGHNLSLAMRSSTARTNGNVVPLSKALVVAQIGLSMVLLVGAGLLTRSLQKMQRVNVGFARDHVLVAAVAPTFLGYEGPRELRLYETLLDRIRAVPGVESATISRLRLLQGHWVRHFSPSAQVAQSESPEAFCHPIGTRFFETMRIPQLLGREFLASDTETAPRVAIINKQLAGNEFPGVNPLGRMIRFEQGDPYTVVGVVENTKQISTREESPRMAIYIPLTQTPADLMGQANLEIRTANTPDVVSAGLRQAVHSVDPDLALDDIEAEDAVITAGLADDRSFAQLVSAFSGLALLLATIGLYGTISFALTRRTQEIGLRMAVGASQSDVIQVIARETLLLVLTGFTAGVPVALAGTRLIANRLFGVTAGDPSILAFAAGVLAVTAVIAALVPAYRASRVDPLVALRWE